MIYAEWTLYGEFENGIFPTWDAYHAATFNPDIEIRLFVSSDNTQPRRRAGLSHRRTKTQ